jgi:hypothetical protein
VFGIESSEVWRSDRESPIACAARLSAWFNGVNIKWLAEYYGSSVVTIERHYGKYVKSDAAEQLENLAGTVTPDNIKRVAVAQRLKLSKMRVKNRG